MKQLKFLFLALAVAVMGMTFASCGNDEPSGLEKQLVGEWGDNGRHESYHLIFDKNHAGKYWVIDYGELCENFSFKWSVKDDVIITKCDDPAFYEHVFQTGRFYFLNDKLYLPDYDGGYGGSFTRAQ